MRRIVCDECKRLYDYDREEFCPRCGAFNPPVKVWDMDSQGNVVRVDGVNERTHTGSLFIGRCTGRRTSGKPPGWTAPAQ